MTITTPAIHSIESEFLPHDALKKANQILLLEGVDPLGAFVDSEINRQHRAVAQAWLRELHPFARSCLLRNEIQFAYVGQLNQIEGEI